MQFLQKNVLIAKTFFLYSQFKDYYFKIPDRKRNYAVITFMCYFNELKYVRKKNLYSRLYANMDWNDKIVFGFI